MVLRLLDAYGTEIDEIAVEQKFVDRVDNSLLTQADIEAIENTRPVRPSRWYGYIEERHRGSEGQQRAWDVFPSAVPFAIVDIRIIDLAIDLWEDPDGHLLTAYRRLEDTVRNRIGSAEHGHKLFSQAFMETGSSLMWRNISEAEQKGRAHLFIGVYMAYRNPRAHRELSEDRGQQLAEFLLLNHLYGLERAAEPHSSVDEP